MGVHRRLVRHRYRDTILTTATSGVLLSGSVLALAPGAQAARIAAVPTTVSSAPARAADWNDDCDDDGSSWCDDDGADDGDGNWGDDDGSGRHRGHRHEYDRHHRNHSRRGKHAGGGAESEKLRGTRAESREIAREMIPNATQFNCFADVIKRESDWNPRAGNHSGAYGIPQALPGRKMASAGADWRTNPRTQIRWAIRYMDEQYGSPCGAWSHWRRHHSY